MRCSVYSLIRILVLLVGSLLVKIGQAQFLFPESFIMIPLDTNKKITGNIAGAFNQQTQINLVTQFSLRSEVAMRLPNHNVFTFANSSQFIKDGSNVILGGGYVFMRFRKGIHRELYPEFLAQAQWKEIRGLQQKYALTANYRWRIKRNQKITLATAAGLMAEYERWGYSGVSAEDLPINQTPVEVFNPRFNWYFSCDYNLTQKFTLDAAVYYMVRIGETLNRKRLGLHARAGFNFTKHLGLFITCKTMLDDEPVVPVNRLWYNLNNELVFIF